VYVEGLGATAAQVGGIMAVMSATAVILRPFVGKAADARVGRRFITVGLVVLAVANAAYGLTHSLPPVFLLRIAHGVGWAVFGTAAYAFVAHIVPAERRGEAMGYYGMASNLAMAVGPALGAWVMARSGFPVLFGVAAALALAGFGLSLGLEKLPAGPPAVEGALLERSALLPSLVYALFCVTYGAVISFLPLYARARGITHPAWFFTTYALTLILTRSLTGWLSDRHGRARVIVPGLLLAAVALVIFAFASTLAAFLLVSVLYGLALAALQPAMLALVVDRAPAGRRGAAMGTFTMGIDLGIASGAGLGGLVAARFGFSTMYLLAAGVALLAVLSFRGVHTGRQARRA
jgi:MFS family permease